jgi:diadenosine tetraphosphate (Ap4A) HIT family hydrolase
MSRQGCIACVYEADRRAVFVGPEWRVVHEPDPVIVPGKLYVTLQRHAESLGELSESEAQTIGPLLTACVDALTDELGAVRVHVGSYGEQLRHVHFHVTPRTSGPRGNAAFSLWQDWRRLLIRVRLAKPADSRAVDVLVDALKERLRSPFRG